MGKKARQIFSGLLSLLTLFSVVTQPLMGLASEMPETEAYEVEYPPLEAVKDLLAEDEIVTAEDYILDAGSIFDIGHDFADMEINPDKVKVTFYEAKNEDGQEFDINQTGTYKAVYFVEPLSGNPKYHICRALTVREPETVPQAVLSDGDENSEDAGNDDGAGLNLPEQAAVPDSLEYAADGAPAPEAAEPVWQMPETETQVPETTADTQPGAASAEMEESGATETEMPETSFTPEERETEALSDEERLDQDLEESEEQDTYDEESGLALHDVLEQGVAAGIDFASLDVNDTVSFMAVSASGQEMVDITVLEQYKYADYGLGTFQTHKYKVVFGDISTTAYCVQPSRGGPSDGKYKVTKLKDGKALAKVCYYGTKAAGDEGFFAERHPDFSAGKRFIITHIAAAYANGSSDAFSGTNSTGQNLAMELYEYCMMQPAIPEVDMAFSNANVTAYADGNSQRTEEITFVADELQSITMQLPAGVVLHNVTTGSASAAGAAVELHGGTRFYLSAPLTQVTDVGPTWSSRMKGSVTKDYSAYKVSTGSSTQDLALVFGEGVASEKYVDFSVKWIELATVSLTKHDDATETGLAGSIYGIYGDEAGSSLIVQMPATDDAGNTSATFVKTQDTVYVKEITAPRGYTVDVRAHGVTVVGGGTVQADVADKEQLGQITVFKEGEVLTGAASSDAGVVFQYGKRRQAGAVFSVYAGADIYAGYGALIYHSGDLVKDNLVTDSNGSAVLSGLHLGTYVIKEVSAPVNFVCKGEEQTVTLSYAGQTVDVVFAENTFTNDRQKAAVTVTKKDKETDNPLQGGIFGLYAGSDITNADGIVVVSKGALIEKAVSGADGSAVFHADLPIGFSYDVKEVQAPEGYLRNTEDVYSFGFSYSNDKEPVRSFTHTFTDVLVKAKITLHKVDAETKKPVPQGDATLEKAVYGLYAREDIVHPDGATGVLYKAGDKVTTLTTDGGGDALIDNLYLGSYFVKEISPPVGYLADEKEHDLICNYEGDLVAVVERSCTSEEQVKKQPFQIIKAANNGETDAGLLAGAGFRAYLVSGLGKKGDGSYDFNSTVPVVVGANGATEIFTDERGYACSIPLPYGTYIVRETTTPHNYTPVKDFYVRITEHMPNTPQVWRVLLDKEFEAKLKIIKTDDETKRPVLAADTEFKIYDVDNGAYIKQVTTYPTTVVHESFFTDEQGYLILPQSLKTGNYRIEEVNAPFGYTLNRNYYNVAVDSDTAYQMDSVSEDIIITVPYENHPVKGELRIVKKGEVLDGYKKDFTYVTEPLAGAVFEVYAAEDIYTADFQTDGEGNRCLEYASGSLVCTVTTDGNGEAVVEDLPLGTYEAVEVTAPEGFVLNKAAQTVTFAYKDQDTPVISQTAEFENARQKVEITAVKKDAETDSAVAGAKFSLYAKEDILAHEKVIVEADTLLAEAVTGQDGKAVFDVDVPFGTYYIREKEAPAGYVSSDAVLEVTASYQGQDVETVLVSAELKNEPTKVALKKSDITTGVELAGATLTVTDKDGNVVDTWTSVKGEEHVIERLTAGETYTLQEEMAPYGYLLAEKVKFTVEDTAEMQKVEMKDDVPTGLLIINKKGEFLEDVSILDNVGGWITHLFSYFSGELKDVTFDVYALEDIKAADGESADYYKKDELVATITTNDRGYAELSDLPLGRYYVKEKETAEGYVLDDEAREIDLTYRDQDTPVVTYSSDWQNNRQKVSVSVLKKEKGTDRVLEGAVFALCAKEDITNAAGDVILEADTVIEEKATNREGKLTFEADLPIGFSYYVKETVPAPGFATCKDVQEFTFQYEGPEQETVPYEYTFEDEPTVVKFTKTSLLGGEEIEGAKLQVTDENGTVVDEWVSEKEPHFIRELTVGAKYTMTELLPAPGYVTAESIPFIVGDTAETQVIEMKDDITNVVISKQDIAGKELPGAKLTILDRDGKEVESWVSEEEPHYIEMLPIGEYILREETAPEGYLVAEEVPFEVLDTWDVQTVIMQDDYTKVEISKQDIAGEELPGAKLTVLDKDGKEVESWVSEEEPHYIEMLPAGGYTLREETAPDGYLVAEDIQFEIQPTGEVQKVVMVDKPVETESVPEGTVGTPKTGDSRHTAFWILLSIFAVCGITASTVLLMKKRRK